MGSFRHPALEKLVLVYEEKTEKKEKEGTKALNKRRRQKASPSSLINVSSEKTLSAKLPDPSLFKVTMEA